MMGDKITAKAAMAELGVPLVPGSAGELHRSLEEAGRSPNGSGTRC